MIRNIVFDMGRVVIRFDPELFIDREGITDPDDRRLILDELFNSVEWAQMDRGILEEKTAEPFVLERFPDRLHSVVRNLLYHWAIPGDETDGMHQLVKDLLQYSQVLRQGLQEFLFCILPWQGILFELESILAYDASRYPLPGPGEGGEVHLCKFCTVQA